MPTNVCGQLQIFTHRSVNVSDEEMIASEPSTSKTEPSLKNKRQSKKEDMKLNWNKNASFQKSLETINNIKLCELFPELTNLSPAEISHKFLPIEYLAYLSGMTNLYGNAKKEKILM